MKGPDLFLSLTDCSGPLGEALFSLIGSDTLLSAIVCQSRDVLVIYEAAKQPRKSSYLHYKAVILKHLGGFAQLLRHSARTIAAHNGRQRPCKPHIHRRLQVFTAV